MTDNPQDPQAAAVLRGRLIRTSGAVPRSFRATLPGDVGRVDVTVDRDGNFTLPLSRVGDGPISIRVTDETGSPIVVTIDPPGSGGEVVVVLPEQPEDIREYVAEVRERLSREREAKQSASDIVAKELADQETRDARIHRAVSTILTRLAGSAGGDLEYKLLPATEVENLTTQAATAGVEILNSSPVAVHARQGLLTDGQQLSSAELAQRLSGTDPTRDGYWRREPLDQLKIQSSTVGDDGLPIPREQATMAAHGPDDQQPPPSGSTLQVTVEAKAERLIDVMRLPEDPPLLVADSAISAAGPELSLARGVADITSFHDFHELVLAMPDVWEEVFDQRFVEVLEGVVRDLDFAGVDVVALANRVRSGEEVLADFRSLTHVYATSSAGEIRPRVAQMTASTAAIASGIVAPHERVLARERNDLLDDGTEPSPSPARSRSPRLTGHRDALVFDPPQVVVADDIYPRDLLTELESYLRGQHSFTVFAAKGAQRAINFGVLITWRQLWEPLAYQTGEITHTMTLSPGETRKVVSKQKRIRKRFTAEAEKSQMSRVDESTDTTRAESDILRKATATTDFQLSSSGSTKLLVSDGSFQTSTTRNVGREGNDTRRRFREAVMKATQDVRSERSIEVKTEAEDIFEEETTAEVRNPNDEVAMTAVYYTLQRRYRVLEQLYRARPVVMVAMPVPNPGQITTGWLVRHAWIIRRNLLDDRFIPALEYLTSSFLGDKLALADLKRSRDEHEAALTEARGLYAQARLMVETRGKELSDFRKDLATARKEGTLDTLLNTMGSAIPGAELVKDAVGFVKGFLGGGDNRQKEERAAQLMEALEEEFTRAERESREAESRLAAATSAYHQATRDYVAAHREMKNHEVRIAELRVHVSDNIVHYMHGIWASLPPDQLFFELHNIRVPILDTSVQLTETGSVGSPGVGGFTPQQFTVNLTTPTGPLQFRPLAEVAILDQLLGFKGNYAIFPMAGGNILTDAILAPYLDEHDILRDPDDEASNWTVSKLQEYADQLRAEVAEGRLSQQDFDQIHAPFLRTTLKRLLTDPRPSEDVIVVPTDSLYVELLTSGGSLIERFKMEHRSLDVAKVRAENRRDELENLRRAARIGAGELEDPDIEAKYVFEGDGTATVVAPGGGSGGGGS